MSNNNIIRAWKDEDYFESLSQQERALVPENPAGMLELSDEDMESVAGGSETSQRGDCQSQNCQSQKNCSYGCKITLKEKSCTSFMCGIDLAELLSN